jgi:lipopolysaccharide export system permease protein
LMMVALAALGDAQTTRQGRGAAVAAAVIAVVALRIGGFAASSAAVRTPWALIAVYGVPLLAIAGSLLFLYRGRSVRAALGRIELPSIPLPRWPALRRA